MTLFKIGNRFLSTVICFLLTVTIVRANHHFKFVDFLKKMFENEELNRCSIQLFTFTDQEIKLTSDSDSSGWLDSLKMLTNTAHRLLETSGVVYSEVKESSNKFKQYLQPQKTNHAKRCSIVLVVIIGRTFLIMQNQTIRNTLTLPFGRPPTVSNRDRYLILTDKPAVIKLLEIKFLRGLKYKLVLTLAEPIKYFAPGFMQFQFHIMGLCQYGLCESKVPTLINIDSRLLNEQRFSLSTIRKLFPDHERNFYGYVLRLSTTTKVPQLLELEVFKHADGSKVLREKRGLYASVLRELSKRLNFTYEIMPSSGNGSTGHALPNGTWVGTVGDTFKGVVDFGFMAAITYSRFQFAELCAPINFAYLGFVTGPPKKSYSWNAIIWPFTPLTWLGLAVTILVSSKLMSEISQPYLITNNDLGSSVRKKIKWSYLKGMSTLIRGLLEQCPEMPENITHFSFRSFLAVWLLFALVCSTLYRSKMVSILTFPIFDRIPSTFDELALAKDFDIDFHYFGNVGYTYFKSSTNPSFMAIYKRMGREPNPLKCLQRTLDHKAACIIFIITYEELLHRNLSDQYGESPLKFTRHEGAMFPAGVIHEHKAPLSSNFRSLLYPAMETGLIPFWQQTDLNQVLKNKNHWQKANKIDINAAIWGHDVTDNLLRVRNLQGAFVILFFGTIAALFSFVLEKTKLFYGGYLRLFF